MSKTDEEKEFILKKTLYDMLWKLYGYPKIWASDEWPDADKCHKEVCEQVEVLAEAIKGKK